jgi:hypothetical protein
MLFKTGVGPQFLIDPRTYGTYHFKTRVLRPSVFAALGYSF